MFNYPYFSQTMPILYPVYLLTQLELIVDSKQVVIDVIWDNINYIDLFPSIYERSIYLSSYYNSDFYVDFKTQKYHYNNTRIEPRTFWQMRGFQHSIVNFNSLIGWTLNYPLDLFDKDFLNITDDSKYRVRTKSFSDKSIYETISVNDQFNMHHDYYTHYVLTTNYYITNLAQNFNNHHSGFYFCYYEPMATFEQVIFPIPSYVIENYLPYYKLLMGNNAFNICINSDYTEFWSKWQFITDNKDLDWVTMQKNARGLWVNFPKKNS